MSSKRRIRRRSCENKQRFDSEDQAYSVLRKLRKTGYRGHVYQCKFCKGLHVGRMNRQQLQGFLAKKRHERGY